jgi:transposase
MDYIEGSNRDQKVLFPESLDEYIVGDNPVRVIDAFVDSLDLQTLDFTHAVLNETGRPPYHPAVLLKLYVYGYLNRIRSSRTLEREAGRNVEVMWLTGKLAPDFKTIANFRRHNRKAIQEICRAFTAFCRDLDLFSRDLVAIDGSKFKAVNSRGRNFTDRKLKRALKDIDQKIEAYLDELDANDAQEPEEPKLSAEQLKEKIRLLKERMKNYKGLQRRMEESDQSQISLTDPDARSMPIGGGRVTDVGYNVQIAVDPKHKLIVDHQVTNAVTDRGLLSQMALRAKEALGVERLDVLTDMGYPGLLGQATTGSRSKPASKRASPPTSPNPTPPPTRNWASLASKISATTLTMIATGARLESSSPSASKPPSGGGSAGPTPPPPAPDVP